MQVEKQVADEGLVGLLKQGSSQYIGCPKRVFAGTTVDRQP